MKFQDGLSRNGEGLDYTRVHFRESIRPAASGLAIFAVLDPARELTQSERAVIRKAADTIEDAILTENIRRDPAEQARAAREREELLGLFPDRIHVAELPNGYCQRFCCRHLPWFRVVTAVGPIDIGWRKSVISIDYGKSDITTPADTLFAGEDVYPGGCPVTRYDRLIHAHGIAKAREYVGRILGGTGN